MIRVDVLDDMQAELAQVLAKPAWSAPDFAPLSGLPLADITADSREVKPDVAFAAFPGDGRDGRAFIPEAIARGASAILWEPRDFNWRPEWRITNAPIPQLKQAIGPIASEIHGNPSQRLWAIGVTGTNGKTTCSTWIAQAFQQSGRRPALIGTLGYGLVGADRAERLDAASHTTPDAVRLQRLLAGFVRQGADCVAMEVSSHGLAQGRVNGVAFDVAVFTNLSRDHLDYHGDMVRYGAAKAKLFAMPGLQHAVINIDEEFGFLLVEALASTSMHIISYGIGQGDLAGENVQFSAEGIRMNLAYQGERVALTSRLLGTFNAHNLLAVVAALIASELSLTEAAEAASRLLPVAGRLELIGGGELPVVSIDYAHTPDALDKVLKSLRPIVPKGGRLICVFGCGGDRDRGKRPQMGAIATELSDFVVVTSDNPRSEPPQAIVEDILAGITAQSYAVIEDRAEAISHAIEMAAARDIVLIAGKGHETYQELGGVRHPFNDREFASRALEKKAMPA